MTTTRPDANRADAVRPGTARGGATLASATLAGTTRTTRTSRSWQAAPRSADQPSDQSVGALLRGWRERRRLTQLELSGLSQVSARHLSFVENGRSRPTSEMIIKLAEQLDVPLRDRNTLLLTAGYAPAYPEHGLAAPSMAAVNTAVNAVLAGHQPMPAVVVDRHWDLVAGNPAAGLFMAGAAAHLLEPPVNVLRLSLHPEGMAPRIMNLGEWRAHLLERLHRQVAVSGDQQLRELHDELASYPGGPWRAHGGRRESATGDVVVPLWYRVPEGELALFSMTTVFGTPVDVTVAELAIESFYPADDATARLLRTLFEVRG